MKWFKLYLLLVRSSIRSRMQYRFNFVFSALLATLVGFIEFLMVAIVIAKFGGIRGWSVYEVGYLYSLLTLSKTIYRTLASDVHHLEKYLVSGDLDQLLIRPISTLLALMSQNFRLMPGEALQGIGILAVCLAAMMQSGQLTWQAVPLSLIVIVVGAVILFSIGLATATFGFWITRTEELQTITEDASHTAARYPLSIYPGWLKFLLIGIIPVGIANYVPALYILRGDIGAWTIPLTALSAGVCLAAALKFWRFGLSRYQSTGS